MNIEQSYKMLMKDEIGNLVLLNEDGLNFLQYILNKGQLKHFKITINEKEGKTLFQKVGSKIFNSPPAELKQAHVIKSVCRYCGEDKYFRTDGKKVQCCNCGKSWRQTVL